MMCLLGFHSWQVWDEEMDYCPKCKGYKHCPESRRAIKAQRRMLKRLGMGRLLKD